MTVYIISGPPGAGKSTTADLLAKSLSKSFHLNCDDIYNMVQGGYKIKTLRANPPASKHILLQQLMAP